MKKDKIIDWALTNGWQMLDIVPSLTKQTPCSVVEFGPHVRSSCRSQKRSMPCSFSAILVGWGARHFSITGAHCSSCESKPPVQPL